MKLFNKKSMSKRRFRKKLGQYWNHRLEKIKNKHRPLVAETIQKIAEKDEKAAKKISKHSADFLNKIIRSGTPEEHVPLVYKSLPELNKESSYAAQGLAENSYKIIEAGGIKGYELVAETVKEIAKERKFFPLAAVFAEEAPEILKSGSLEDYKTVSESICEMNKNIEFIAWNFTKTSANILKKYGIEEYSIVKESICKAAEEDRDYAKDLVDRSMHLLEKFEKNQEITTNSFLAKSIRNPKDVKIINKIINFKNPQTEEVYDTKCGQFY